MDNEAVVVLSESGLDAFQRPQVADPNVQLRWGKCVIRPNPYNHLEPAI